MPHPLANLKKAEIKTIELLIPTHLSPATVAIQSARLLSPKRRHLWRAMSHCILKNAHSQHRYCRLLWQWDGWFLPRSKTATVMPDRIRAVHESMTLKRLRATMERRECNYVYVALCIHIDSGVMGTSSVWLCVHIYLQRGRCVGKEQWQLLQQFRFEHSKRERESTCSHLRRGIR